MTRLTRSILILTVAAVGAGAAAASQAAPAAPAIQFDQFGGVKAWRAGGDNIVFVQDAKGQWYKAVLYETCMSLDTSKGVKFITEVNPDDNQKVSKVQVDRHICTVASLTRSSPPPAK